MARQMESVRWVQERRELFINTQQPSVRKPTYIPKTKGGGDEVISMWVWLSLQYGYNLRFTISPFTLRQPPMKSSSLAGTQTQVKNYYYSDKLLNFSVQKNFC